MPVGVQLRFTRSCYGKFYLMWQHRDVCLLNLAGAAVETIPELGLHLGVQYANTAAFKLRNDVDCQHDVQFTCLRARLFPCCYLTP